MVGTWTQTLPWYDMNSTTTSRKVSAFVARFVVTFFLTGSIKFGAVLFESVSNSKGFSNATAGLLFILPYAIARLLGPVCNELMRYFSPRVLSSFGGFLFGAGYICSGLFVLRPHYTFLFFTLSGVGLSCMLLPTVACLTESFQEDIRLAMPLAMLGSYAGITIIPLVTVHAHKQYGTKAALLLFGAISWNLVPCGLLLVSDFEGHHKDPVDTVDNTEEEEMKLFENAESDDNVDHATLTEPYEEDEQAANSKILSVLRALRKFTNVNFCLFFIIANLRKIPNDAWTLYLIPRTEATWMSSTEAATVASIGGMGGVIGRLVGAVSFKTRFYTPIQLCSFYFIANGFIFVIMEVCVYPIALEWPAYVASFLNGLLLSAQSGMIAGIIHLLVSEKNFLTAYAVIDLGNGLLSLLGGFGPGYLADIFGGYGITFTILGIISLICGALTILIWLLGMLKLKHSNVASSSSLT